MDYYSDKIRQRILLRNSRKVNRVRLSSQAMLLYDDRTPTTSTPATQRASSFARPRRLFPRAAPVAREIEDCERYDPDLLNNLKFNWWVEELPLRDTDTCHLSYAARWRLRLNSVHSFSFSIVTLQPSTKLTNFSIFYCKKYELAHNFGKEHIQRVNLNWSLKATSVEGFKPGLQRSKDATLPLHPMGNHHVDVHAFYFLFPGR